MRGCGDQDKAGSLLKGTIYDEDSSEMKQRMKGINDEQWNKEKTKNRGKVKYVAVEIVLKGVDKRDGTAYRADGC